MQCLQRFYLLSFYPRDVLDEILNLIESVSGGGGGFLATFVNTCVCDR